MWFVGEDRDAIKDLDTATSDRSVAIIAYALVDARLKELLKRALHRDDTDHAKKTRADMFHYLGPLGPLGVRVKLCYLMGVFSEQAHKDITTFIGIRNDFAHYTKHYTFDSESMRSRCFNLKLVEDRVKPANSYMIDENGNSIPIDTMGSSREDNYFCLNVRDHAEVLASPRERFIATAKLFVAACYFIREHNILRNPIL